jgi:hypothetical protein
VPPSLGSASEKVQERSPSLIRQSCRRAQAGRVITLTLNIVPAKGLILLDE